MNNTLSLSNGAIATGNTWCDELLRSRRDRLILANLANALIAFRKAPDWLDVLAFDEMHLCAVAMNPTPWGYQGRWDDQQDRLTADWLQHHAIGVGVEIAGQAIQTAARGRMFHPLRQFLSGLNWDRVDRLEQWTTRYLGTDNTNYTRAVGQRFLIGLVARAFRPGCKLDSAPILEGPQGTFKSTAAKVIGGEYFTDEIAEFGSKDAALQLSGAWLIELAELEAMGRAEVAKIKAFMSRTHDRFRPPYGRNVIEVPRGCAFVGTTNADSYLRDEFGARRFWPLRCGRIEIDPLTRDRNQLLAEACVLFNAGAPWWLDSRELTLDAADEQQQRYEADPWQVPIAAWADGREPFTVEGLLERCLKKERATWTQADRNRIGRCLRVLGFERRLKRTGNDKRAWLWFKGGDE